VIAVEPDLREVLEPAIAGDLMRRKVTVVGEDGLRRRVGVLEMPRRGAVKKKIVVDERHRARASASAPATQ
jgi:hypothetical protein